MKALIVALVLLSAAPAFAHEHPDRHPGWLHAAIAASMIAHGADLSATSWALGKAGDSYREANPILRPLSGDPVALAIGKMGLAVGLNYGLLKIHAKHPRVAFGVAVFQTIAIGYVAHRNAEIVRR